MTKDELRDAMAKAGHKPGTLAELLDVHRNTVSRWLNGRVPIHAGAAALIREKLRIGRKR